MKLTFDKKERVVLLTRRPKKNILHGFTRSKDRGSGLEFEQLRDYTTGDDVRCIDWNSSARAQKILVKQFAQETHRTVLLAIDVSQSAFYGKDRLKYEVGAYCAALLAHSAQYAKDSVGLIVFSDRIEQYIKPKKNSNQLQAIIKALQAASPERRGTDITAVLHFVNKLKIKNMLVCLISDFIVPQLPLRLMQAVATKHELVALRLIDAFEQPWSIGGRITVCDSETEQISIISMSTHSPASSFIEHMRKDQQRLFARTHTALHDITSTDKLVSSLQLFFKNRR